MRWFRFYDDVVNDPKVQSLPADLFKSWINILCVASKNGGVLPELSHLAFALRCDLDAVTEMSQALQQVGLLDKKGSKLIPHNWNKRQFKSDTSAERTKRYRDNKRDVTVTPPDTDYRTDTEKKVSKPPNPLKGEPVLPECVSLVAWQSFKNYRGKKFTANAQEIALRKLEDWYSKGHDPTEIINASIMNGWKGLFEPKGKINGTGNHDNQLEGFGRAATQHAELRLRRKDIQPWEFADSNS